MKRVAFAVVAVALGADAPGAAADEMLRGPHPFLRDNEISVHAGVGKGYAGWFGGPKLFVDYGYRWWSASWLDLQMNYQQNACTATLAAGTACQDQKSSALEMIAGVRWKWRMDIPIVPYVAAGGGPVYVFPESYRNAMGLTGRGVAGGKYFLYDWFGLGAEVGVSLGHVFHNEHYPGTRDYATFDLGLGVEFQF